MKNVLFAICLFVGASVHGQNLIQKSPYQFTTLKIIDVSVQKDTVSLKTEEGLSTDEVFRFVNANQRNLEGIAQIEVIDLKGKKRDYYTINIKIRKAPEQLQLPFQGSFYIGYHTNQYKFRYTYSKNFGISAIAALDINRPEDGLTIRFAPALTSDFQPFLINNMRGSIDLGPMFGSQIPLATLMVRTSVERNFSSNWSFGFNYMLVASQKRLSEWGAGLSYNF
ncbi:MAG: hypothetical protein O2862_06695 [Bacteroidetes bacterium]|nr:hypothetical protein [Bacteroidota bacterium]